MVYLGTQLFDPRADRLVSQILVELSRRSTAPSKSRCAIHTSRSSGSSYKTNQSIRCSQLQENVLLYYYYYYRTQTNLNPVHYNNNNKKKAQRWPIAVILGSVTILKVPDVCANFQNFLPDGKGATMRSVRRIIRIIIRRILTITIGIHASL